MAEYLIQDTTLDAIADAINTKLDTSVAMTPAEMVTAIGSIQTGGGGLPALISEIECGDIQVVSVSTKLEVQTSLQNDPDFIIIFVKEQWQRSYNSDYGKHIIYSQFNFARAQGQPNSMNYGMTVHQASIGITFSNGIITFNNAIGMQPKFSPTQIVDSEGATEPISYRWIAGSFVNGGGS